MVYKILSIILLVMTKKRVSFYKKRKYSVKYRKNSKTHKYKRGGNNVFKKSIDNINTPKTNSLTPEKSYTSLTPMSPIQREEPPLKPLTILNPSKPMSPIRPKNVITQEKKAIATEKIKKFIKSSKKFLNIVCPKSGACIAFGKYTKELNDFFKNFIKFEYVVSPIRSLGAISANGFVKEIEYERDGYKAHAILKSSQNADADNLLYEYLVGFNYINKMVVSFPCFIETYGFYYYNSKDAWKSMKNKNVDSSILQSLILQEKVDFKKACIDSTYICILIQHIQNAMPLMDKITNKNFIYNDLFYIFFIIYQALSSLSKTFTHYDLHANNVLIYKPYDNKFIEYHYHNKDGTVNRFYSPYIPKIIDYGRSFFDNGEFKSREIYDEICYIEECKPHCGYKYGFSWLNPKPYIHISSSKKNESHDLRLIHNIMLYIIDPNYLNWNTVESVKRPYPTETMESNEQMESNWTTVESVKRPYPTEPMESNWSTVESVKRPYPTDPIDSNNLKSYNENYIQKILSKIVFGVGLEKKDQIYGTEENLNISSDKIYNVNGLHTELKKYIEDPNIIQLNQNNYNNLSNKLGDLHVYYDQRPMVYERNI